MVDAHTITDMQILELGRQWRDGTGTDATWRFLCSVALGLTLSDDQGVFDAKEKLADAWNARHKATHEELLEVSRKRAQQQCETTDEDMQHLCRGRDWR